MSSTETEAASEEGVPPEVEAQDGILNNDEAHNTDRPARSSLKKKTPPTGKPLSEFSVGQTIKAKVKTITSYGAFLDIGSTTDGLLHISNLSSEFVSDVKEFLSEGQETEVRITNIDEAKNQVGLTRLTEEEEKEAKQPRQPRGGQRNNNNNSKRDDSAIVAALANKGWDSDQFVEGTVASTVDFGAFVRFDASQLNSEVEGEMDGLVHISALTAGRASSVTSVVNAGDKVKIRCKSIDGRKVSLTMMTVEEEQAQAESRRSGGMEPVPEGAKDWKESLEKFSGDSPTFSNTPMVVDLRK
jgi:elongation factor Ts